MVSSNQWMTALAAPVAVACLCGASDAKAGVQRPGPRPMAATSRLAPTEIGCENLLDSVRFDSDLDAYIESKMAEAHLPGLSACAIHGEQVIWSKAYGLAQIDPPVPVTTDTLFAICSISKTITTTALMRMREEGAFALDDPVNDYLPFLVQHPQYPGTDITFRMALSNTGSFSDNWDILLPLTVPGDSPIPLAEFLPAYLVPGGEYYSSGSYLFGEPGTTYHYSNIGFTLAGYLGELMCGEDFAAHCDAELFEPLGMTETSFMLADLDLDQVAMPYVWDGGTGEYEPYFQWGMPIYPAGTVRTSPEQLARILMSQMNAGTSLGVPVLAPLSVAQMQTVQVPPASTMDYCLGLYRLYGVDGELFIGHGGDFIGSHALMFFRPADHLGIIVATNGDPSGTGWSEIFVRLGEEFRQSCPGDVNHDDGIDVLDLLDLLAAWGPCEACAADSDHDGVVDVLDLLTLLGNWGRCPHIAVTGPLGPIGSGAKPVYTLTALPPADSEVTFSFSAIGDLGEASEHINVLVNGTSIGVIYDSGASDCPIEPDAAQLILSAETFNSLVSSGSAVMKLVATAEVDPHQCDGFSYINVRVEYVPVSR